MKKFTIFILSFIFILIVHCTLYIENCMCQWYQINLPIEGQIYQMQFINHNTGWISIMQSNTNFHLLRTTDSGSNWDEIYHDSAKVESFQFINDTLGYARGEGYLTHYLLKTTNKGYNWTIIQDSPAYIFSGFYMLNSDTGYVNAYYFNPPNSAVIIFRTLNGFQTLENISTGTGSTSSTLFFLKEKYNNEYCGFVLAGGNLSKTTNSGFNWQLINTGTSGNVNSFSFLNKDTGLVVIGASSSNNRILKTENGGSNFIVQFYDSLQTYHINSISAVNNFKIWCGTGSNYLFVSSNGGANWGKQSSPLISSGNIYMIDTSFGFAWNSGFINNLIRTINGGGPILSVEKVSEIIPTTTKLMQNYPNPFNTTTTIEIDISRPSIINLKLFDALGREVLNIINSKNVNIGKYKTLLDLSKYQLASGIYFYKLFATEKGEIFQITKKINL